VRGQVENPTECTVDSACSVAAEFAVAMVRHWTPERNGIGHTHGSASSEQAWEPNGILEYHACRKTRTVPNGKSHPDDGASVRIHPVLLLLKLLLLVILLFGVRGRSTPPGARWGCQSPGSSCVSPLLLARIFSTRSPRITHGRALSNTFRTGNPVVAHPSGAASLMYGPYGEAA
jgi:hypothetical protein